MSSVLIFQLSHLFDNEGTVAFAMFMAVWGMYCSPAVAKTNISRPYICLMIYFNMV